MAPRTKTSLLWHYSDAAGVIGILGSHTLRASSLSALNDSTEYKHGRNVLEEAMREVVASRYIHPGQKAHISRIVQLADDLVQESGLFVLCASRAAESLAQWRAYGGTHGHAIVLDAQKPLAVLADANDVYTIDNFDQSWRDVLYDPAEQRELVLKVIGFLAYGAPTPGAPQPTDEANRASATTLLAALAHCKDPSFAEEQEARVLVRAPESAIKFRAGASGIIPYVELTANDDPPLRLVSKPSPLPVRTLAVGPFATRNESADGGRALLKNAGYPDVETIVSTSTLR